MCQPVLGGSAVLRVPTDLMQVLDRGDIASVTLLNLLAAFANADDTTVLRLLEVMACIFNIFTVTFVTKIYHCAIVSVWVIKKNTYLSRRYEV
jgi:hypothetical protein